MNELNKWPHPLKPIPQYTANVITDWLAQPHWVTFINGIEKMSTGAKLSHLDAYRYNRQTRDIVDEDADCQITSYLLGMQNEGLLNQQFEVIK